MDHNILINFFTARIPTSLQSYISTFQSNTTCANIIDHNVLISFFAAGIPTSLMKWIMSFDTTPDKINHWYSKAICYTWSWVRGKHSLWGQGVWVQGGFTPCRIKGVSYARDFLGKGSRVSRMSHWFRAPVKALKESMDKGRKRGTRLIWQCTRVQRRSSLREYVASWGFIYLRLRRFWNKEETNGVWWNAIESWSTYEETRMSHRSSWNWMEGSNYEDKCGQQADDKGRMVIAWKEMTSPGKEKNRGEL